MTKTLLAVNSYNVGDMKGSLKHSLYGIDDIDNEDDLDIEKSGFLEFEKKKSTFGRAKWRGPFWFVLKR